MLKDRIAAHPEIEEWLGDLREGRAPESTKVNLAGGVRRYCQWRGKEPIELLEEVEEDLLKTVQRAGGKGAPRKVSKINALAGMVEH